MYTDPIQDLDELNFAKSAVINLAFKQYSKEKIQAMEDMDTAKKFIKEYPKDDFSSIIDSNLSLVIEAKSHNNIYKILTELPATASQKNKGLDALRSFNSFNGFSTAFDLSGSVDDAKKAKTFAISSNDKQKVEYMGIKLFKAQNGSLTNIFDIDIQGLKESGISKQKLDSGWFSVNTEAGKTEYSFPIQITAKRNLGLEYGVYDVGIKSTLKVPVHYYRRSKWLGNADENKVEEYTENKIIRIKAKDFSANTSISFNNVTTSYLDRGMMGGITEIVMNGSPTAKVEVTNVTLVE